jgi:hypothetical protein
MNECSFKIDGQLFTLNESNYKSQFDEIIEKLTPPNWITNNDLHSSLMERGIPFLIKLREAILSKCKNSQDYSLHITIIEKLLNISKSIGIENHQASESEQTSFIISNYSSLERLSLAVELYENEFRTLLSNNDLDAMFLEIISYIKNGDLDYFNETDISKLPSYIKWIKNKNKKIKEISLNKISQKKKIEEANITSKLESAWNSKKTGHMWILICLCVFIFFLIYIGYSTIEAWMLYGNTTFDNCCKKMGFVDLIYGAIIHWAFQYKLILIAAWIAIISQLTQIAKSQWHLFNDASERIAIIETYKIFSENKLMGEPGKYIEALLQSVFKSADDGMLKDVKTIFPSGLYSLGAKTKEDK